MALNKNINAILNYASSFDKLPGDLLTMAKPEGNATGNWAKIYFTGDGDIITHGKNYTSVFKEGVKGLVPGSSRYADTQANKDAKLKFLDNSGAWKELTVAELPIAATINDWSSDTLFTSQQIHDHFNAQMKAVEAMRFLGVLKKNDDIKALASAGVNKGDTYRIGEEGDYAGIRCQPGDLMICVKDSTPGVTGDDLVSKENGYWTVVETNINGTIEHTINGTKYLVYSNNLTDAFTIYAPTTAGTEGQVLVSKGGAETPSWLDQKDLLAGDLTDNLKAIIAGDYTIGKDGSFQLKNLLGHTFGTPYTPTITGENADDWNINIKGKAAGTKNKLTVGDGLAMTNAHFDGSADVTVSLKAATKTTIGGVIIDPTAGTVNDEVSTISVKNDGTIYLTKDNISNALGFLPGSTENVYSYTNIITKSATLADSANEDVTNPFFNLTATRENESKPSVAASTQFIGSDGLTITGSNGTSPTSIINFTLNTATASKLGGIKIAKTHTEAVEALTSNSTDDLAQRYYGVELDKDGKAFVYVPWEDKNPAFNKIIITNDTTLVDNIVADTINSSFGINAGNGLTAAVTDGVITIHQDYYEVVASDKMGYAPAMVDSNKQITKDYRILSYTTNNSAAWNILPDTAFKNTWRAIQVNSTALANNNGTDVDGNIVGSALNFTATGDHNKTTLSVVKSESADTAHTINIASTWRPILLEGSSDDINMSADDSLKFASSNDLELVQNVDDENHVHSITFELSWYNLDTQSRESVY